MVGTSSKILTVSYGTFSCTLEGFDDPFSTMRSIAEYFRDLAADDRYFGAEPPTPDAEMLHRIAEREVRRRVESRVEGNGVVLRPAEERAEETREAEPEETAGAALSLAPAAAASGAGALAAGAAAGPEGIADKLKRIREAVHRSEDEPPTLGVHAEDEHAEEVRPGAPINTAFTGVEEGPFEEEDVASIYAESEALAEERGQPEAPAAEAPAETAPEAEAPAAEEKPAPSPEPEAPAGSGAETLVEEEFEGLAAVLAEDADDRAGEADTASGDAAEAGAAPAADPAARAAEPEIEDLYDFDIDTLFADEGEDGADGVAAAPEERPAPAETGPDGPGETPGAGQRAAAPDEQVAPLRLTPEQEVGTEEGRPVRARVVKMRREEFERAFEESPAARSDETEAPARGEAAAEDRAKPDIEQELRADLGETGLSPEEEAELVAELAAAQRDTGEEAESAPVEEGAEPAAAEEPAPAAPVRPARPRRPMPDSEASVDRLLRQTDTELGRSEGNRRRSAIAHLKAAVAAIRAEGGEGAREEAREAEATLGQYRDDLARVVRPARPAQPEEPRADESRRGRRMPPLMLVSSQRVDGADAPAAGDGEEDAAPRPVQPRRVSREEPARNELLGELAEEGGAAETGGADTAEVGNIFSDTQDFDSFVRAHGAEELTDILEASAAFSCFVEGNPHCTRADIIRRVNRHLPQDAASREDLLRAFGTILREGRLQKVRRGVFTLSEDSRFQPRPGQSSAAG